MIDTSMFNEYLEDGEKLLWTGKPKNEFFETDSNVVTGNVIFMLFVIFLEILDIKAGIDSINKYGYIFLGYYIMFVVYLAAIIHSIYKISNVSTDRKEIWNNTNYIITDRRVMVIIHKSGPYDQIIEDNIDDLKDINIFDRSLNISGVGTIIFGDIPLKPLNSKNNFREDIRKNSCINQSVVFNNIEDVDGVYALINKLINK